MVDGPGWVTLACLQEAELIVETVDFGFKPAEVLSDGDTLPKAAQGDSLRSR